MNGVVSRLHANVGFGEAGETSRTTGLGAKQTAIDQSSASAIHHSTIGNYRKIVAACAI
jgi:hypothetical protein